MRKSSINLTEYSDGRHHVVITLDPPLNPLAGEKSSIMNAAVAYVRMLGITADFVLAVNGVNTTTISTAHPIAKLEMSGTPIVRPPEQK